jgi:hypothetical protein
MPSIFGFEDTVKGSCVLGRAVSIHDDDFFNNIYSLWIANH